MAETPGNRPIGTRHEYYWVGGRVIEHVVDPSSSGAIAPSPYGDRQLIVAIERMGQHNSISLGPQQTPERLAQALLRFSRYSADPSAVDMGKQVPQPLRERVAQHVKSTTALVTSQYEAVANEEGQTGLLSGVLNSVQVFKFGEWEATIRVQVFSPQTKEPKVGADIGVIVDVRNSNTRIVKASLIQAKRTRKVPDDLESLKDMRDQLKQMRMTTSEAYAMVYTEQAVYIIPPDEPQQQVNVDDFLVEMIICKRGDRAPRAVAQAYDRSIVIDVTLATGLD